MSSTMAPNVRGVGAPGRRTVYSMCGMCAVRCPIEVTVEDGRVAWLQGNPHDAAIGASLCAKGSAGLAFEYDDDQRPQTPLIRMGPRGGGQWRRASWDEALDYIADKLNETIEAFGARGIALSDRGGPFNDLTRTFVQALGSPNYFNHDATCGGNVHNAARSIFGFGLRRAHPRPEAHQAPGALRPQHRRIADGQGGQGLHGRGGQRDARHLHRSARQHDGLQGHPLLAGAPEQRLRAEPGDHPRGAEAGGVRQGLRRPLRLRDGLPARGGQGHDAGMAGAPYRRSRRPAARLREGDRRPGAAGDLPSGLDDGASQAVVLRQPHGADPERADGQHRDPGRVRDRQAARVLRPQEPEAADRACAQGRRAARGRRGHHAAAVGPGDRHAAPGVRRHGDSAALRHRRLLRLPPRSDHGHARRGGAHSGRWTSSSCSSRSTCAIRRPAGSPTSSCPSRPTSSAPTSWRRCPARCRPSSCATRRSPRASTAARPGGSSARSCAAWA